MPQVYQDYHQLGKTGMDLTKPVVKSLSVPVTNDMAWKTIVNRKKFIVRFVGEHLFITVVVIAVVSINIGESLLWMSLKT